MDQLESRVFSTLKNILELEVWIIRLASEPIGSDMNCKVI